MPYPSPVTYPSPTLYPSMSSNGQDPLWIGVGDLVLGAADATGAQFTVAKFDGWGSPASTAALAQRARGHGATSSEGFYRARVMTIEGLIIVLEPASLSAAVDSLSAAVTLAQFAMLVSEQGRVRNLAASRQDDVMVTYLTDTIARYSIQVVANDPLKYGDLVTATTLLPSSTGGLVYPVTYPVTYSGVSNSGVIRVVNEGNTQAPVWLRIDGPIPAGGWTVTHVGKKQSLTFASSLALDAGEFVTVDMENREILAQGQAPRAGYVTSRGWFSLDPGANDIAFSAQNYSPTAQLTVTTKPAWA